ncbi:MAG: hypothetical protein ACI87J_001240 [Colwellia sp.]|jgi:uncharacterized protein YggE
MTKLLMSLFVSTLAISTLTMTTYSMAFNVETPSIEVKGQASVLAEPNRFSLTIAITERGRLTDKIRAVVDDKSNQVVHVAKSLGIKDDDINSARVSLSVIEKKPSIIVEGVDFSQRIGNGSFPTNEQSKVTVGTNAVNSQKNSQKQYFELRRTISVNFLSIDNYDQFLIKVIKLGVNDISPLVMSVVDTEKHYQQALIQAMKNAKNKAVQIANHSNVVLGKLLLVKELSSNYYRPQLSSARMSAEAAPNHSSEVGNQVINASVLVKFSIEE